MVESTSFKLNSSPMSNYENFNVNNPHHFLIQDILPFASIEYNDNLSYTQRYKLNFSSNPFVLEDKDELGNITKSEVSNFRFKNTNSPFENPWTYQHYGNHLFTTILMDSKKINSDEPSQTKSVLVSILQENDAPTFVKNAGPQAFRFGSSVFQYCFDTQNPFSTTQLNSLQLVFEEYNLLMKKLEIHLAFIQAKDLFACNSLILNGHNSPQNDPKMRGYTKFWTTMFSSHTGVSLMSKITLYTQNSQGQTYPDLDLPITFRHELLHALGFDHINSEQSIMNESHDFSRMESKQNPSHPSPFDLEMLITMYKDYK